MATFKIKLDQRIRLKNGNRNLCVVVCHKNKTVYLKFSELSESTFETIFVKQSTREKCIQFREDCAKYQAKCERIYNQMDVFDEKELRIRFNEQSKKVEPPTSTQSILLKDMFAKYVENTRLKHNTKKHYQTSLNVLLSFKMDLTYDDITTDFIFDFEKGHKCSKATISSYLRDLRSVILYYIKDLQVEPMNYIYPFGRRKYIISSYFPQTFVMAETEVTSIEKYEDFLTPKQEYARDIWFALYLLNGSNFVDLLKLKWSDIKGDVITFTRTKTESRRKNNIKQIVVDYDDRLRAIFNKIGNKKSPYILGQMKEHYSEVTLDNRCLILRRKYNKELEYLSEKLDLSVDFTLNSARETFATMLYIRGVSIRIISELMGHSNVLVTEHYLGSLSIIQNKEIKKLLV